MEEKKTYYITTTLPYVNADPHIGFAYEIVVADALARYYRLRGAEVFFNTGTDEHGQKIAQKADEKGEGRQAYVDYYANEFKKLADPTTGLNLSFDNFIRTTDEAHKAAAQEIWRRCLAAGDIYKKKYSGLYCVGCELFYKESELLEGNVCPIHTKPVTVVEEENYFFALSKYQSYLEEYLSTPGVIAPEWRRQEAITFVKGGLEDFSISREKARLDWGIAVPDDEDQVMYVWFDALTNYISTLGWPAQLSAETESVAGKPDTTLETESVAGKPDTTLETESVAGKRNESLFEKFWTNGNVLQLAGKDQVRFQSVMWQAMLKSAGVKATDKVIYHGFINSGGQKMSKSLGNVISPYELIARYGTDATRYLLLRHVHPFDDTDVTWDRLDEWYTANLVNGLGNLVARVMKMAETHLDEPIARPEPASFPAEYTQSLDTHNLQAAPDYVWGLIGALDERITAEEPFKLVKVDKEKAILMIKELATSVYEISRLLQPLMPETSARIKTAVLENKKPDNLFIRLEN